MSRGVKLWQCLNKLTLLAECKANLNLHSQDKNKSTQSWLTKLDAVEDEEWESVEGTQNKY